MMANASNKISDTRNSFLLGFEKAAHSANSMIEIAWLFDSGSKTEFGKKEKATTTPDKRR